MGIHSYIYIQKSHYKTIRRKSLYGSGDDFMESIEKYLDRNHIPFTFYGDGVKVVVTDRFQAHMICSHFGLHDIDFVEGEKNIVLHGPKKISKQGKAIYEDNYTNTSCAIPKRRKIKKEEPATEEVGKFRGMFAWSPIQKLFESGVKEGVQGKLFNINNKKWATGTISTKKAQ